MSGGRLIPDSEAPVLMDPAQRPFHHPTEYPQAAAVLRPPLRHHRLDPQLTQSLAVWLRVVAPVAHQRVGLRPRWPAFPATAGSSLKSGANSLTSWMLAAVTLEASGMPWPSVITWCLLPGLARSTGLGPVFSPP